MSWVRCGTWLHRLLISAFFLLCHIFLSVSCSLVVTCWEKAGLLVLLYVMFMCVFVTFPSDILRQVWYLMVSIPDICLLPYFGISFMSTLFFFPFWDRKWLLILVYTGSYLRGLQVLFYVTRVILLAARLFVWYIKDIQCTSQTWNNQNTCWLAYTCSVGNISRGFNMHRTIINYLIGGLCLVCISCLPDFTYADGKIDIDMTPSNNVTCVSS